MTLTADYQPDRTPQAPAALVVRAGWSIPPALLLWLISVGALAAMTLAGTTALQPSLRFNLPLVAHASGLLAGYGVTVMLP
jgi:hypothetical protein